MSNNYDNSSDSSNAKPQRSVDESSFKISQDRKTGFESNLDNTSRTSSNAKKSLARNTIGEKNRYRLQALIEEGGMSQVYRALDTKFEDYIVAIKIMTNNFTGSSHYLIKRFMAEVKAISCLKHPNIIQILDFGITPEEAPFFGSPFYVMEYLPGKTLQKTINRK